MASAVLPKSIQRTDSTGQLNVFILFKKKTNDDLIIISREDLSPTLRSGRLVLNQKIIIRDDDRNSIEGSIVYMHADRDACAAYKEHLLENKTPDMNQSNTSKGLNSKKTSSIINVSKQSNPISRKPFVQSTPKPNSTQKTASNKKPIELESRSSNDVDNHYENFDNNHTTFDDISNYPSPSATISNGKKTHRTAIGDTLNASITIVDGNENDVYLDKINELSTQLERQKQIVKLRENEIKRLQSTTIEIPTDQATCDYICRVADKIREITIGHRYVGSLNNDAKTLGLSPMELNEILKKDIGVSGIARLIFKRIVPEEKRIVNEWKQLGQDIIVKEKLLLKFLESYYGSLKANPGKLHKSLVGCLRNDRGKQKKARKQFETLINHNNDYDYQDINDIADDDDDDGDLE